VLHIPNGSLYPCLSYPVCKFNLFFCLWPVWVDHCVLSRPDPGRECVLDVALLGEGRSSNLGQGSEVKAAHSSNNFSVLGTWVFYYVLVSYRKMRTWAVMYPRRVLSPYCLTSGETVY
jgi:hypothetical protein